VYFNTRLPTRLIVGEFTRRVKGHS